jgi:uncharacterized protein (DUF1501 family)
MKRRKFIQHAAIGTVGLPGILNGFGITAHGENSMMAKLLFNSVVPNDHVLVYVQMSGGNDGLNTVIPLDQYSNYYNARTNIAIAQNKVLALTGTLATGLHPSLTGFRDMYNNGDLCIVQSAGYPTPSFSHFRATDIWMTASNSNEYINTGWLGRYLNGEFPGFPVGYPNAAMPDPLGIQFGSATSLAMLGPTIQNGYTISDPNAFVNNADGGEDVILPGTPANDKLIYVREISKQSQQYAAIVQTAYNSPGNVNLVTYPVNSLANQLKIVARLINGGLKTKVYVVTIGGFDTHSGQVNTTDTSTGTHANLMAQLSDSIKAFHSDLKLMNKDQRVLGVTFSEFGRRIKSTASIGTDHGYGAPMFVFGTPATGSIIGANPVIPANPSASDNLPMINDFRDIYYSIMKRWLCQDAASLTDIMIHNYNEINICDNAGCLPGPGPAGINNSVEETVKNFPNPVVSTTNVEFKTEGGPTLLQLMSPTGTVMQNLIEHTYDRPKTINLNVDMSQYKPGLYYFHFQNGKVNKMKAVVKE